MSSHNTPPGFEREAMSDADAAHSSCSFCGRARSEVNAMFRSHKARICDRCISDMKTRQQQRD